MAARSKAWVYGRSFAGIVGSNAGGGMDVCLLWVLCDFRLRLLRRVDRASKGVLPNVVCLSVIMNPRQWGGLGPLGDCCATVKRTILDCKMKTATIIWLYKPHWSAYVWCHNFGVETLYRTSPWNIRCRLKDKTDRPKISDITSTNCFYSKHFFTLPRV